MIFRNRRDISCIVALGALILFGSCAGKSTITDPDGVDPKFSISSYVEEGDLVAFVVSTRAARNRESRDYTPFEIAIVNKGVAAGLTLTRESFVLVDENGTRYPAVGREELDAGYGNVDLDRRLGEIGPIVRGSYQSFQQVPSTFTPSFDKPTERRLSLPRYSWALDWIYFPRAESGVRGHRFELFMTAPELDDPVFVRFEVGGKPAKEQ